MKYEVVIGLEVHAQLLTQSKMFCSCSAAYQDADPNTVVCPVCMGMPGVLPVINRKAVEHVIRTGLALNCDIAGYTKFDRKNYPYPDLMKGYQISQYDLPIASTGSLPIEVDGVKRAAGVTRVHLEEDVARLLHRTEDYGEGYSLLDVNRAGVPLMEIVGEPDLRSAEEARAYLMQLHSILQYIGVSTANMEEGNFRCDANISVRPEGESRLGTNVEIKNMNSFRSVFRALEYEAERQVSVLEDGGRIVQETRGWVEEDAKTVSQRTKEGASDYRYFPEPDLPPLRISRQWVQEIGASLPELPHHRRLRFVEELELPAYDAALLTVSQPTADYFERVLDSGPSPANTSFAKAVSNWMLGEMARLINQSGGHILNVKIEPGQLAELQALVDDGTLSSTMAKTVFEKMFESGDSPREIAQAEGLSQISDADAVLAAVRQAISDNPGPVREYLDGKQQVMGFIIGQVMKATRGKANPRVASQLVRENLEAMRE
ncbi:MAG: Asp-tRNA(Asn)/Glu-tRNA(Gln) amidotransferase subunit GatB [Dehalococcoidia bacterium]|nr:Asp-tRNA(Asn)/Glu-tRNA(Gln) amidotransferase subunit GatB [Dehalococcoidia bacterium]